MKNALFAGRVRGTAGGPWFSFKAGADLQGAGPFSGPRQGRAGLGIEQAEAYEGHVAMARLEVQAGARKTG